jgi:hypothetical protein
MPLTFRKYGKTVEITELEKERTSHVRFYHSRKRRGIYGSRRADNIRRTRKICMWRVSSAIAEYGSPLLVTLTFDGDASNAAYADYALSDFQVRLRTQYPEAQSIFVPELSPRGRIHFHGLLFNLPLSLGDKKDGKRTVQFGEERETRILAKIWGEGYVDAIQTDGSIRLAGYICKYITKGAGEVLFNAMRMLRISHGFPKDLFIRGEEAEIIAGIFAQKAKPVNVWSIQSQFWGKITKTIYHVKK